MEKDGDWCVTLVDRLSVTELYVTSGVLHVFDCVSLKLSERNPVFICYRKSSIKPPFSEEESYQDQ